MSYKNYKVTLKLTHFNGEYLERTQKSFIVNAWSEEGAVEKAWKKRQQNRVEAYHGKPACEDLTQMGIYGAEIIEEVLGCKVIQETTH